MIKISHSIKACWRRTEKHCKNRKKTVLIQLNLRLFFPSRGVEPYDPPTTVLVQRHEPQGVSTILRSTDFFQSEENRRVIIEQVDSFQLRDKYMFATTKWVRELGEDAEQIITTPSFKFVDVFVA